MTGRTFRDRAEAGRGLAAALAAWAGRDGLLVLGLPRGGVVPAAEVARELGGDLDVLVVRKIGVPGHEELALGAVAHGQAPIFNAEVLRVEQVPRPLVERLVADEQATCADRERRYRAGRPPLLVAGRPVILVDDGLATGATMRAAVAVVGAQHPSDLVVAVPVAPRETLALLEAEGTPVVCLSRPLLFRAVGWAYDDFDQVSDEEVLRVLRRESGSGP